jgi:Fur family ferric uptake transcriptional regulator
LLVHTHLGHRPAVYHLAEEAAHQHFVCDQCGATVAVSADDLAAWSAAIRERTGFVIESSHFALTGRCAECAAAVEHPTRQA